MLSEVEMKRCHHTVTWPLASSLCTQEIPTLGFMQGCCITNDSSTPAEWANPFQKELDGWVLALGCVHSKVTSQDPTARGEKDGACPWDPVPGPDRWHHLHQVISSIGSTQRDLHWCCSATRMTRTIPLLPGVSMHCSINGLWQHSHHTKHRPPQNWGSDLTAMDALV